MLKTEGKILYCHSFHSARQYWYFLMPGIYCLNLDHESGKTKLTRIEQKMIYWAYWLSRQIINKIKVNLQRRWSFFFFNFVIFYCLPTNIEINIYRGNFHIEKILLHLIFSVPLVFSFAPIYSKILCKFIQVASKKPPVLVGILPVLVTQSCLTPCIIVHQAPLELAWNSGVGSHSLLQGIFPTQGLDPGLSSCPTFEADSLPSESPGCG